MLKFIRSNKGFSLVELMIVVAIIGILASVAIPNFQRFQRKARQSEAKNLLSAYYTSEKAFQAEYNSYAGNFYASGFKPDGNLGYHVATTQDATSPFTLMNMTATAIQTSCVDTTPANCPGPTGAAPADWTEKAVLSGVGVDTAYGAYAAATATTFGANAAGFLGTATSDRWTIDQNMVMTNTASGL